MEKTQGLRFLNGCKSEASLFRTNPKRHHFLPEFYLHGFSRDGYLWLYDREKREYRRQAPRNTAVVGQFYTTELEGGETDTLVEEMLSQIETKAKPIIDSLVAGERLAHPERADLSYFLAFLFARTPKFERETLQIADSMHKRIAKEGIPTVEAAKRILLKSNPTPSITAQSFYDFVHKEQFSITGHRNLTLELMISQARKAAKELVFMNWEVVHAPAKRLFITSDSPFGYIVPESLRESDEPIFGILSEKLFKVIPLSAKIALRIGGPGIGFSHVEATRQELGEVNVAVAKECDRFLIGSNADQVRYVVAQSRIDKAQVGTRLKLESVNHPSDPERSFLVCHRVPSDRAKRPFNPNHLAGAPRRP
jgi:hypothetical protein